MEKNKNRRKIIVISRKFQHQFIYDYLLLIISCILFVGVLSAVYYYFRYHYGEMIFKNYWLAVQKGETIKVKSVFSLVMPAVIVLFIILTAFMSLLLSIFSLYYSHKIAGPVYRFKKTIEAICKKDFSLTVRLRTKDKIKEIEEYLNKLIDFLNKEAQVSIKFNNNMNGYIKELKKLVSPYSGKKENIKKIINKIEKLNSDFSNHLSKLKLK